MADSAIDQVAQAIDDLLWATGSFKTHGPNIRKETGTKPAFMVWWPGFSFSDEAETYKAPTVVTHRFQVDVFASISGVVAASEKAFRQLVQDTVLALKADPRLKGTCLRSRVRSGANDIDTDGNNPMFVSSITLEVDRTSW